MRLNRLGYGHRPPSKPLAEAEMEGAYFLLLRPGVTVVVIARAGEKYLVVSNDLGLF